jgi:hypothetical protein
MTMRDFFISYRRPDVTGALWVQHELDLAGYSVWIQKRDLEHTTTRPAAFTEIDSKLRRSHILVVCLSYDYLGADDRKAAYEYTKYEFDRFPHERQLILLFEPLHFESDLQAAHPVRMYDCWREERKRRLLAAARAKRGTPWKLQYGFNPRGLTEAQVRRIAGRPDR